MVENRPPRIFYGYYIVIAGFFIVVMNTAANSSFGIFFEPLLTEFGWTRAVTSGAMSLAAIIGSICNIIAGRLSDRFSPRLIMTVASVFTGLGIVLLSQIDAAWQLFACFSIIGIGGSCYLIPTTSTVARWFVKRRGMMTSIIISALGAGEMVMPLIARWLIAGYGWRHAYTIIGVAVFLVILLGAQFMRRDPGKMGLAPYGMNQAKEVGDKLQTGGLSLQEAMRTREFWILGAIMLCYFFAQSAVSTHIVIHATGLGISSVNAVNILFLAGVTYIASLNITGNVVDRIGKRAAIVIGFALQAAGLLGYMAFGEVWLFYLFALIFGFGRGSAMAPMPLLMADIFGLKSFGVIQGAIFFSAVVGGIVGPILAGHIFDITGSYFQAFIMCAAVVALGLVLTFTIRAPRSQVGAHQ